VGPENQFHPSFHPFQYNQLHPVFLENQFLPVLLEDQLHLEYLLIRFHLALLVTPFLHGIQWLPLSPYHQYPLAVLSSHLGLLPQYIL
jgi:hypothetical protein